MGYLPLPGNSTGAGARLRAAVDSGDDAATALTARTTWIGGYNIRL